MSEVTRPEVSFQPALDKRSGKLFSGQKEIATLFFWDNDGLDEFLRILDRRPE